MLSDFLKFGIHFVRVKQNIFFQSRVSECQQRVNDLIDLRLCSDGVKVRCHLRFLLFLIFAYGVTELRYFATCDFWLFADCDFNSAAMELRYFATCDFWLFTTSSFDSTAMDLRYFANWNFLLFATCYFWLCWMFLKLSIKLLSSYAIWQHWQWRVVCL